MLLYLWNVYCGYKVGRKTEKKLSQKNAKSQYSFLKNLSLLFFQYENLIKSELIFTFYSIKNWRYGLTLSTIVYWIHSVFLLISHFFFHFYELSIPISLKIKTIRAFQIKNSVTPWCLQLRSKFCGNKTLFKKKNLSLPGIH